MSGIYIHIPFCRQACTYCDFYFSTRLNRKDEFMEALLSEIRLRHAYLSDQPESLYFGGGTPSLLSADQLKAIEDELGRYYNLSSLKEVTLEVNPDDINPEKVRELKSSLVSRISLGVQSFHDSELQWMHRAHNAGQALNSIRLLQDAGFTDISIDLIYGTPGLSDEAWLEDINTAFDLGITHLSCYALTLETGTAYEKLVKRARTTAPDDEKQSRQFGMLMDEIEKRGWEQYEISNFCRDGHYALHNSSYWKGAHYLGLGPSAHSYNGHSRQWNIRNLDAYIGGLKDARIFWEKEEIDQKTAYNEYIMTSLRTKWGCDIRKIIEICGDCDQYFIDELNAHPFRKMIIEKDGIYTLSREGKFYADRIASELFL